MALASLVYLFTVGMACKTEPAFVSRVAFGWVLLLWVPSQVSVHGHLSYKFLSTKTCQPCTLTYKMYIPRTTRMIYSVYNFSLSRRSERGFWRGEADVISYDHFGGVAYRQQKRPQIVLHSHRSPSSSSSRAPKQPQRHNAMLRRW